MAERSSTTASPTLAVRDLGRMPYGEALQLQRRCHAEVVAARDVGGGPMHLLLLEHDPPVITLTRRAAAGSHLLASPAQLAAAGVVVAETDRGGDITYHGPGQIVAYPILDLNALGLRLHEYMRFLEQVVIDVLRGYGIAGQREAGATGVWLGGDGEGTSARKICAMGVRVSRWVSMHGLALNVTTDLAHFDLIVPCGLAGRAVTSMERELGPACPSLISVKQALADQLARALRAPRRSHPPPA